MADRPDIDALLISALYGELTPADETRLAVHLESHPADRTALADLTHARDVVRESRILQFQFEPPQAVSALLLQEAARRVPRASREEKEGWFARFVRSFAAHPAMAAAAMLVVVVGVATVISKRKGDHFAESTVSTTAVSTNKAEQAPEGQAAATQPTAAPSGGDVAMGSGQAAGSAATDEYPVDLYTGAGEKQKQESELRDESERVALRKEAKPEAKNAESAADKVGAKSSGTKGGVEVRTPSPQPKDFDDGEAPAKKAPTNQNAFGGESVARDRKADSSGTATIARQDAGGMGGARPGAVAPAAPSPPPPAIAAPTTSSAAPRGGGAPATEDTRATDPALAWARDQHQSVVAQVRAGNCKNAAGLAVTLSNRAPGYYAQNVATDRDVKECLAYINNEVTKDVELRAQRERVRRSEATKRAVDAPAKAAPAKPAATESTK